MFNNACNCIFIHLGSSPKSESDSKKSKSWINVGSWIVMFFLSQIIYSSARYLWGDAVNKDLDLKELGAEIKRVQHHMNVQAFGFQEGDNRPLIFEVKCSKFSSWLYQISRFCAELLWPWGVKIASCERSFSSKLKIINSYLRWARQISNLSILSIEQDVTKKIIWWSHNCFQPDQSSPTRF